MNDHVKEEDNGVFELEFTIYENSFLFKEIKIDRLIKADASPDFKGQLFRIYYISKNLGGYINVKAQHIKYDLLNNFIESLETNDITCEEALERVFRACEEKNRFRGHSDIKARNSINISMQSPYSAICEGENSLIQIFEPSAKFFFDNFDVYLNYQRGESKNVLLAYRKNITGLEAEYDTQDIITKIYPYATYEDEMITLTEKYITSPRIAEYATQKIVAIDFSSDEISVEEELREKCKDYFKYNQVDLPKTLYKVNFVDLSTTVNYKDYKMLETVNIGDEVIIRDFNLNINATARVVKTDYSPIQQKYYSIEVGDLINHLDFLNNKFTNIENKIETVKKAIDNVKVDDSEFPDTLPDIPILTAEGLFAFINLTWTFTNKSYYKYEVYASQIKDFVPDTTNFTNRIFIGQASAYVHQAEPFQTWYFRVRATNSHGNVTEFSSQEEAQTTKIEDGTTWIEKGAIADALIGELKLDRGWFGQLKGMYINAREMVVVNDNGIKTMEIDSFGDVHFNPNTFKIIFNSVSPYVSIDDEGLKLMSKKGFTRMTDSGLYTYFSTSSDITESYYLQESGYTTFGYSDSEIVINLPQKFAGKRFKATCSISSASTSGQCIGYFSVSTTTVESSTKPQLKLSSSIRGYSFSLSGNQTIGYWLGMNFFSEGFITVHYYVYA
ncbi:phage tail protein [Clostridioides sp. ES-S-0145-01]|uniref:phage tail spike protein n=1 Tax=Clostridioides sp. ES-S-0145-01 TaxID=2770784 RepID=UPI001D117702|nr:phage tail protein [Clostridioides sp. ES-S-0145-01]UDN60166.1 phage tail protein [Clostridioides sp. ES-S-0010-02]